MNDFVETIGQRIETHISSLQGVLASLQNGERVEKDLRQVRQDIGQTVDLLDNRVFDIS